MVCTPPPWDHRRALGIVLLKGPVGTLFRMIEVTLWAYWRVIEGGGEAGRLITWDLGEGDEALLQIR